MKTMTIYEGTDKSKPVVVLTYDDNSVSNASLCEHLWTMLSTACEMDGFTLTTDLYEICEEVTTAANA